MSVRDFIRYRIEMGKRGFSRTFSGREFQLTFDPDGFTVQFTNFRFRAAEVRTTRIKWSEITRIVAWKEDNFTWDSLWLTFYLQDGAEYSVSEEAIGWTNLLDLLPVMVQGFPKQEDWWLGVVQPAFAPNATQLYPMPT
jgi:hypothetical protein